jgi:hypothetical protein
VQQIFITAFRRIKLKNTPIFAISMVVIIGGASMNAVATPQNSTVTAPNGDKIQISTNNKVTTVIRGEVKEHTNESHNEAKERVQRELKEREEMVRVR